jgi:hypothetical protein
MSHHHHHGEHDDPDKSDTNGLFWGFIVMLLLFGGVILAFGPARHHAKAPSIEVTAAPVILNTPKEYNEPAPEVQPNETNGLAGTSPSDREVADVATPEIIPHPDPEAGSQPAPAPGEAGSQPNEVQRHTAKATRHHQRRYRYTEIGRKFHYPRHGRHHHAVEAPRTIYFPESFFLATARAAGLI